MISDNNADSEEINQLIKELETYKLSIDDPLNKLINIAKKNNA